MVRPAGGKERQEEDEGSDAAAAATAGRFAHARAPLAVAAAALVALAPTSVGAQHTNGGDGDAGEKRPEALRVYLECAAGRDCDQQHFRREIDFVDWVREPEDGEVHVMITSERTGSGGRQFTFDFLGRGEMEGLTDRFSRTTSRTDVRDEVVERLTRNLRLGLVRYATLGGYDEAVDVQAVSALAAVEEEPADRQMDSASDPWNFWVFSLDGDFGFQREDREEEIDVGFGFSANRTTGLWKVDFDLNADLSRETFQLSDTVVENNQDSFRASAFAVRTTGEHWGVGLEVEANNSTRYNRDLLLAIGSGLEWNFFPYTESTRRVLLARYVTSVERVDYSEITIFDVRNETVFKHEMALEYNAREPWGNARLNADVSQFLDRRDFYSMGVGGNVRYRIFRGLSVNLSGRYRLVEDQIFMPRQELTDEDILLGRVRLPTESESRFSVGLGYSFGSMFNNTVNSRFRRGIR